MRKSEDSGRGESGAQTVYIASQDDAVQSRLKEVREIIHIAIPDAEERISWSMPTF